MRGGEAGKEEEEVKGDREWWMKTKKNRKREREWEGEEKLGQDLSLAEEEHGLQWKRDEGENEMEWLQRSRAGELSNTSNNEENKSVEVRFTKNKLSFPLYEYWLIEQDDTLQINCASSPKLFTLIFSIDQWSSLMEIDMDHVT